MKKIKIFAVLLSLIGIFLFAGCTDKLNNRTWKDDYSFTSEYFGESQYNNSSDKLDALLNGTFVFAHSEYTFTNKSTDILRSGWAFFLITPENGEPFEIGQTDFKYEAGNNTYYIGDLKPGEKKTVSVLDSTVEEALEKKELDAKQRWIVTVSRIEYKISEK